MIPDKLNKLIRNQEITISLIGIAGMLMLLASYGLAGLLDWYFVAGFTVYVIALMGIGKFLESRGKYSKEKRYDERKAMCVQRAARNGFVFALVLIGIVALISGAGYNHYGILSTLMLMYALIVTANFLSYMYYLGKSAA